MVGLSLNQPRKAKLKDFLNVRANKARTLPYNQQSGLKGDSMINIQRLLAQAKAKENNQLVKGVWFLIQWSPDDYSQERFNIGVAFHQKRGEKQVKFTKSFRELSNWYGE